MATGIRAYMITHPWFWPPLLLAGAFICALLHNVVSALLGTEEPVFFILTFVLALAGLVALIWLLIRRAAAL